MRRLPMIRSLRAAVLLSLLMLMPLFMTAADPINAVAGIVPCVLIGPGLLSMTALWAGLLPAAVGWIAAVMTAWLPFGMEAGLRMALFLFPGTAAFLVCVQKDVPFFRTALFMIIGEVAGGFAVLLIMTRQADGQLAVSLTEQYTQLIADSGMQDEWLIIMMRAGMAQLDPSLYSQATGIFGGLSDLGREELLLSFKANLTERLTMMPAVLLSASIMNNLAGPGIGIYFGRRSLIRAIVDKRRKELLQKVLEQRRIQLEHGEVPDPVRLESKEQLMNELNSDCESALKDFPTLQMPPFSKWHLPRRIGLMAALPGIGYVVAYMASTPQQLLVGNMLASIFSALYTIQGLAAVDYIMGHAGRGLGIRCAMLAVANVLLSRIILFVGVIDQLANFRKLRPQLGEETRN